MGDTCVVCLDVVDASSAHTLDCEHVFHADCIIGWLRRGNMSCPSCRFDLNDNTRHMPVMAIQERSRYMRNVARRRNAPSELKRLVAKIRVAECKEQELNKMAREFHRENREIMKESNRLRSRRYSARRRVYMLKSLLGIFHCTEFPLPALSVINM